jgi:drug/metabolite transporter (DMT)-like permease
MQKQNQAYVYALTAVLFWSTVASAFKLTLEHLEVIQLLFIASLTATSVLFVILLLQGKLVLLKSFRIKAYLKSALMGCFNPFIYYLVLFQAYSLLPAQQAQPLNYTWPVMLALLSVPMLNEKLNLKSIGAILICFIGVLVISTQGDLIGFKFSNAGGALLALGSSVLWALFWILNLKDDRDETIKLFLNFAFGSVFITLAMCVFSDFDFVSPTVVLGAVYIGVFEMGLTFLIWAKALELSETTAQVSKFIYLAPFLSLVFIYFLVGEKILVSTIVGLVLIVTGIVLEQINSAKSSPNPVYK